MRFTTTVRVLADDAPTEAPAGFKVELYDRDMFSSDDLLGSGTTDAEGVAVFRYSSEDFVDWEERLMGNAYPTLYARVYGPGGELVATTRAETERNKAAKNLVVHIPLLHPVAQAAAPA
ncbi:MAG TPA: hypothetical protein VFH27_07655 [Longimicrobiaceae bacterium]|nr:hypothetical protein [Longimicrobiaceae bacterium]